ncbi:MAG: GIY-YIG nuclease family protein [Syntrophomonadales bacterium]|jgi:putative endonuclease
MDHEDTYYVYIVKCADTTLYTGMTNNLEARLSKHNLGQGAKYTRGRRPVSLAYCETVSSISEALRREMEIKKMSRSSKLALVASWSTTGKP